MSEKKVSVFESSQESKRNRSPYLLNYKHKEKKESHGSAVRYNKNERTKHYVRSQKVKIGIAPIAWTEDDMPEMGAENSFLQTISEIALTGYVGTEIGCQFPRDPAILNKEFGRRGISAITGWISTYLNELPMWQNERAFVDHMNFLKSIGATIINTSDQSFSIQHQWNTPLSNKKVLNDDEWEVLTKGLDHLGKIAYDSGMKIVYHHHMTTTVQKTDEIDRMLAMTDPKYVSMIYDTGHLTFSGEDPIEILQEAPRPHRPCPSQKCPQACNGQVLRRAQELPPFDSGRRIHRSPAIRKAA